MKKFTDNYLSKQVATKPSRTQSPDFLSANRIKPTKSPKDISYTLQEKGRLSTPIKSSNKNEKDRI